MMIRVIISRTPASKSDKTSRATAIKEGTPWGEGLERIRRTDGRIVKKRRAGNMTKAPIIEALEEGAEDKARLAHSAKP